MSSISVRSEDRLEGASNFSVWKLRIMNVLQELELEQFVTTVMEEPATNAGRAAFRKNQAKAKRVIFDSVKDSIMPVLTSLMTAKDCYDTLMNLYEKTTPSQKRNLKNKLKFLKMEKGESIASFCSKIAQIRDQLLVTGITVEDDDLVQAIFDGLPPSWDTFLASVNGRETQPAFERLWHDCLQEEGRMTARTGTTNIDNVALAAKTRRGRKPPQKHFQKNKYKGNFKGKDFDMSKIICFNCNKKGHYARDCRSKKRGFHKGKHHASTAEEGGSGQKASESPKRQENKREYYLVSALSGHLTTDRNSWLVDSGASKHMTGYKNILSVFRKKTSAVQVQLGDNSCHDIKGIGSTSLQLKSGSIIHIDEILFVPGLKKNLLSVSALEDKGFKVAFMDGKAVLWPKDGQLSSAEVIGIREGGLYKVTNHSASALAHSTVSPSELWHRRFGHLHFKALPGLQSMVSGMPHISSDKNEVCKGCLLGKNAKKTFPHSSSKSEEILELIHSDICGPMSSLSLNGFLYYVIFIDDLSRKCWIYFLKLKSEAFIKFKEFKALIENQTGKRIQILRSDNGGEYESHEFESFCKEAGIKRQLTVPYNPQQNGVAERKNRTICEAAKAMMFDQDLPNSLWVEATGTAVYIQNRCPHAILEDKTPEEAFSGKKPEVGHLRVFGCPVYIHVPKEKRTKMEPSGKKGIFVGYSESSKAYRIYVPGQRQIEVSRDVTFHEEVVFKRSRELQSDDEPDSPSAETSGSDFQREESHDDPRDQDVVLEPAEELERSLEEPPFKRRPAWFKEILQEAEKHAAPPGTFRESRRPQRFAGYVALVSNISDAEPSLFDEANKLQVWRDAMLDEYKSIMKNDVWDIVSRPKGKSVVSSKWLYKIKHAADGSVEKYKARFVARGFSQKEGIDYDEIFAPVARYTTIRSVMSLASVLGWKLYQMDVKTAFLNGEVEQEVYVEQPDGFVEHSKESHVCKLKKALYGLKQAPRVWYDRIDGFLRSLGFSKSSADPNLYFKVVENQPLILVLYVDDLFLTGEERQITWCKKKLTAEFEMKDLGLMHYFLGLEVWQKPNEILLSQGKYAVDILKRFGMMNCRSVSTPMVANLKKLHDSGSGEDLVDSTMYRQLVGSLMYLTHTRPDMQFAVSALSQFMAEPRERHWVAGKHILRYLRGTIAYGLKYTSIGGVMLHGYADSDWAGSPVDRKSTSGYCFSLGSAMISWSSRKQGTIAQSTAEAEYIAASNASREAVWLRKLISGLFGEKLESTIIHCDNQSCIKLTENPVFHDRSKHIDLKYHYIRDMVQRNVIKLKYIATDDQVADILTKPLQLVKFALFRDKLGVAENASLAEREC